jgi:hypothetical protein
VNPEVFISYTHKDNEKLSDERQGWIDYFHDALTRRVKQIAGRAVEIWRDPKLGGNDLLTPTIEAKLRHSKLFIAVLSPGYLKSDWCAKELRLFRDSAVAKGGLHLDNSSRIFYVTKTPIAVEHRPGTVELDPSELIGYTFYRPNERGHPHEFDPRHPEDRQDFLGVINDLACDLCEMLDKVDGAQDRPHEHASVVAPSGVTVYLAETSFDLAPERERLRRELEQFGHTVLPERPLQLSADYPEQVKENLAKARLSVHLIGKSYGVIPEGQDRSAIDIQYELAGAEAAARGAFIRLPWMSADLEAADPRLEKLHDDPKLLIGSLETLKTAIGDVLAPPALPPQRAGQGKAEADQSRWLYVLTDPHDAATAKLCSDWLFEQTGFNVLEPLEGCDEREIREDNEESLKSCDAVLVYYGEANEFWLRTKLRDLQKAFGYGRQRPFLAKAVFLADPERADKERFKAHDIMILNGFGPFAPSKLLPFVEKLVSQEGQAV